MVALNRSQAMCVSHGAHVCPCLVEQKEQPDDSS